MAAVIQAWLRVDPRFAQVDQVDSVAAARAWAARDTPDILVLDYTLPDGTAADVLAELRALDATPAAVLYTSRTDFAELGEALGCHAAVHKGDWAGLAEQLLTLVSVVAR